jgi:hypothetical protein
LFLFKYHDSPLNCRWAVPSAAPKGTKRRFLQRICLFTAQAFSLQNKTELQAANICNGLTWRFINLQLANL